MIINGAMTSQMHMRGEDAVVVSALPCPHVYANVLMNGMMMFGTKLVLHKTFDPVAVMDDISAHNATIFDGVPTMYMFMMNSPAFASADLSSLSRCYVGGQTMPVATMKAVEESFNVPLIELLGQDGNRWPWVYSSTLRCKQAWLHWLRYSLHGTAHRRCRGCHVAKWAN